MCAHVRVWVYQDVQIFNKLVVVCTRPVSSFPCPLRTRSYTSKYEEPASPKTDLPAQYRASSGCF